MDQRRVGRPFGRPARRLRLGGPHALLGPAPRAAGVQRSVGCARLGRGKPVERLERRGGQPGARLFGHELGQRRPQQRAAAPTRDSQIEHEPEQLARAGLGLRRLDVGAGVEVEHEVASGQPRARVDHQLQAAGRHGSPPVRQVSRQGDGRVGRLGPVHHHGNVDVARRRLELPGPAATDECHGQQVLAEAGRHDLEQLTEVALARVHVGRLRRRHTGLGSFSDSASRICRG